MKIVEKSGNFVIKETNEKERKGSFSYLGDYSTPMDNYYIYLNTMTAKKFEDEYISTANSIEEAREIVAKEQINFDFDLLGFAKKLHKTINTMDKLIEVLDETRVEHEDTYHEDSLYKRTIIHVNFCVQEYVSKHTIILALDPLNDGQYYIETIGVI